MGRPLDGRCRCTPSARRCTGLAYSDEADAVRPEPYLECQSWQWHASRSSSSTPRPQDPGRVLRRPARLEDPSGRRLVVHPRRVRRLLGIPAGGRLHATTMARPRRAAADAPRRRGGRPRRRRGSGTRTRGDQARASARCDLPGVPRPRRSSVLPLHGLKRATPRLASGSPVAIPPTHSSAADSAYRVGSSGLVAQSGPLVVAEFVLAVQRSARVVDARLTAAAQTLERHGGASPLQAPCRAVRLAPHPCSCGLRVRGGGP